MKYEFIKKNLDIIFDIKVFKIIKKLVIFIISLIGLLVFISFLFWFFKTPSNDREWEFGQQKLQKVTIKKTGEIMIDDLRDYDWTKIRNEENYENFNFNIFDIEGLEVGVSHFSENEGIAHVFLIFNLKNKKDIALSIETRRDNGEDFGILKGLTFDYELIYILATKKDLLSLREKRKERIYIYPIKVNQEKSAKIFTLIAERVNSLYKKPEFYHILFKNCTKLLVDEVKKVSDKKFPWYEQILAPGYTGKALFEMGLINTNLQTFEEVKNFFLVKF